MKKFRYYFYLIFTIICFFIVYRHITSPEWQYMLILSLIPTAMIFSYISKFSVFIFMGIASAVTFYNFGYGTQLYITVIIFLSLIPVLYYFLKPVIKTSPELTKKNNELKFYKHELLNEEQSLNQYKTSTEEKLEKTLQFYLISKNLTKNISPEESGHEVCTMMSKRKGVSEVVVIMATQEQDKLIILATSNFKNRILWQSFLNSNLNAVYGLKDISFILSEIKDGQVDFISQNDIYDIKASGPQEIFIVWPIIVGTEFKAGVFLKIRKDFINTYIEEGELFIPYFSLHAKRIMLFLRVEEKSRVDGLTGTYLRRYFMTRLSSEIQRVKRYKTNFYLMMLDIDFFKKVNDTYGHLAGDKVLKTVAQTIISVTRPGDLICRYGGEEFIILIPMTENDAKITDIAENIRTEIKKLEFDENGRKFRISVSIGIKKYEKNLNALSAVAKADEALYEAKQTGRDKVVFYGKH